MQAYENGIFRFSGYNGTKIRLSIFFMKIEQSFLLHVYTSSCLKSGKVEKAFPYPAKDGLHEPIGFHACKPASFLAEDQIVTHQHQDCRHNQAHQPIGYEHCQNHAESHAEYYDPHQSPHLLHNGQPLPCRIYYYLMQQAEV